MLIQVHLRQQEVRCFLQILLQQGRLKEKVIYYRKQARVCERNTSLYKSVGD